MKINPTLAKQLARRVSTVGVMLWRHMAAAAAASAAPAALNPPASSSRSGGNTTAASSRLTLSPATIKQQLTAFAAQDSSYQGFLQLRDNRNIAKHISILLQLLAPTDDPLTIEGSIVTARKRTELCV